MADSDLRRCPSCGTFFIENATYSTPDRCPNCKNIASESMTDLPSEAEVAVFEEFYMED